MTETKTKTRRAETTTKAETGKWAVVEMVDSRSLKPAERERPAVNYHTVQSLSPYEYAGYLASLNID